MGNVDWKISAMKGLGGVFVIFISIMIAGLTAQPELVPVWGGILLAVLNFVKHYLIQIGVWK